VKDLSIVGSPVPLGLAGAQLRIESPGLSDDLAHSPLRFGSGRFTTDEQIDYAIT
jgi:cysteine sulfinate desulfinase/cysteine desulfurase-like protein